MHPYHALAFALSAAVALADPLACQPNAQQPMLPAFHIIGNVTQRADGGLDLEPINDASGVTFYEGIYHVWHQCCQNHWDHVISRDLIHWQRLPPPIQPVTLKTWDGSVSMIDAAFGGPLILYDAQDGKSGERLGAPDDSAILGVARLVDPANDKYLQLWARAANNPVNFSGAPIAFPGQVWRNGDHFNFVGQGNRFTTTDATFHSWTNAGPFNSEREHSGQWTMPVPNQVGGAPPPPGSPNLAINVNGGADYELGFYDPAAETFVSSNTVARLENGRADWWGGQGGSDNNNRMMIVGWAMPDFKGPAGPGINFLTRLTLVREVNFDAELKTLVANPLPELVGLRAAVLASERGVALGGPAPHVVAGTGAGAAASADVNVTFRALTPGSVFGACVLANDTNEGLGIRVSVGGAASDYFMPGVDLPGGDYNVTDVSYSDAHICQAACTADGARCQSYTYVTRPPLVGSCCLKGGVPAQDSCAACTSGIKAARPPGSVTVQVGSCADALGGGFGADNKGRTFALRASARAAASVTVRILADRSVADFFIEGGSWSGTVAWLAAGPRRAADSAVTLFGSAGVVADVDVWGMGCGWADPSYTENPTM
jgi:hypothetical protein